MSFDARRLRHRVLIEQQVTEIDSSGESEKFWEYVGTFWGAIEPISGREMLLAEQVQSQVTTRIVMRYRSDVTPSMRAKHGGQTFNIEAIIGDPDSGIEWMTLQCSSGLNQG